MKLVINTDGGARGNPGPAGIGVVIVDERGKVLKKISRYLGDNFTNNQAEYAAVIEAMIAAKNLGATHLEFQLDSELCVRQLNHVYKVKNLALKKIFLQVKNLQAAFDKVVFTHIPREQNRQADGLVNQAIDGSLTDSNYSQVPVI